MAILYTAASLLSLLTPQGPGTEVPALELARLLPKESLVAVAVNPLAPHQSAIQDTGLYKILDEVVFGRELGPQVEMGLAQLGAVSGLTRREMKEAASHGMAFAFKGLDRDGNPEWVWVVNLGDSAEAMGKPIERILNAAKSKASVRSELWQNSVIHHIRTVGGASILIAVHGDLMVVASSRKELKAVLARRAGRNVPSLSEHPEFARISRELAAEGKPLLGVFIRPGHVLDLVVNQMPPEIKKPVSKVLAALDVNRVSAAAYAIYVRDGEFHDYVRVVFPEPRSGLLATLLTGTGELNRNLFQLIPPDVIGYAVGSVSIPAIVEQTLELAKGMSPTLRVNVSKFTYELRKSTGVDPEEDLLSPLGDQFLSLQWPAEKPGQGVAVLINLHDPLRFKNALEVLQPKIPVPIKWDLIDNRRVYRFRMPAVPESEWPVMTVVGDYLLIAGGERAFQAIQAQLKRPRMNHDAQSYLADLPEGTFMASWVDLASSLRAQLGGLAALANMTVGNETYRRLLTAIEELAGTTRTTASRDERGSVFRSHSPVGNLQALAMLSIGAAVAIPNLVAARSAYRDLSVVTHVEWDANVTRLMQTIAGAQEVFRDSGYSDRDGNGIGEYGTLSALRAKGLLSPVDLGAEVGSGVFRRHGYLISLFLPDSTIAQETHFVAVAWPDKGRTGQVYGSTPDRHAMVNDIIARETGIQQIDPRDIFISGSLTAGLVAGWRDLESTSTIKPRFLGVGNQAQIEGELRLMQQAEEQGDRKLLIVLLNAQDPAVAARAAHDLGNLRAMDAVPDLCSALSSQPDLGVRLQIMGALNKIGDPRSYQAAVESLSSENVLLRALAAANLGNAGNPEGVQPLLTLLGSPETDSEDQRDRVQALISLNELARTECLLPAAAATSDGKPEIDQALAYLFQNLSPKLAAAEEASSLMSVLNHQSQLLRRYAIQRLGELKDGTTVRALEGRLAVEDESLRPLILVALDSIRAADEGTPGSNFSDRVNRHATGFLDGVRRRWSRMSGPQRLIAKLGVGMLLIVAGLFLAARARRKRREYREGWAAMVAPSSDLATAGNEHAHEEYPEEDYEEEVEEEEQVDFEEVADEVLPEPVDEKSQEREEMDFTVWDYDSSEPADEEEESAVGSED